MKRTVLSNIDHMLGTGWQPEELEIECPNCYSIVDLTKLKNTKDIKCELCSTKFKIEYGVIYLIRGVISE